MASLKPESKLEKNIKQEEDFFNELIDKLNKLYKERIEEEDNHTTPPGTPFSRVHYLEALDLQRKQEE